MENKENSKWLAPLIFGLAIFSVVVRLLILNNLEYHRDELLYFSLGQHPAAGYATVPPVIGWLALISHKLFGYSLFAVRIIPAITGGVLMILVSSIAKELGGSAYASLLAAVGLMISVFFMRTFSLFMPVFVEIFLWTLCIYLVIKYINTDNGRFLLFIGIVAGFAMLNKYLAALLFTGLALIIPFTPYRSVFKKKMFLAGLGLAFIIFLPNLIWQVSMGFPVTGHMSELYSTQLVHMDAPLFLKEQLIMPFMGSVLTVGGLIFLLFRKRAVTFRFLGLLSLFVIFSLMFLKGKSYYTLGVFPLLIAAGAVAYDNMLKRKAVRIIFPILLVVLTIPALPIGLPVFGKEEMIKYFKGMEKSTGMTTGRRFEDGSIHSLPQDYADMIGWEELTAVANKAYQSVADKKSCFIYGENYGQAGAITVIGKKYGLPEAVCFSESFRYWYPDTFSPDIKTMIYINRKPGGDIQALFRKITVAGRITDPDAREYGTTVYICQDPVGSFNSFWIERVKGLRKSK